MSSELPPEADSEEGKLQGTNAGGQVRAAPVDVAAAMPSTDWERQVWGDRVTEGEVPVWGWGGESYVGATTTLTELSGGSSSLL